MPYNAFERASRRRLQPRDTTRSELYTELRPADQLNLVASRFGPEFDPERALLPMTVKVLGVELDRLPGEVVPRELVVARGSTSRSLLPRSSVAGGKAYSCQVEDWSRDPLQLKKKKPAVPAGRGFVVEWWGNWASPNLEEGLRGGACSQGLRTVGLQYPQYQDAEQDILGEVGITVLDSLRAFLEVDDATAVVSLVPETPVRARLCELQGLRECEWLGRPDMSDNDSPRLERMIRSRYTELPFPEDAEGFASLPAVYVRKH
ncbi:hypothetical protein B0T26DRAFT_681974 [Lasiosphaeria miniovina]|uniref:Uncharacterized protein n=1 Tax=Lasiosphaeria miniovina TaxID=1954250 RepID=A0AA40DIB5_9PEZI|nr:uncharacterized protein B0T26DRAFT_681974 [Lasiosphaeria miniovina]KAK0701872.1 hypothetical protein B0T26DRAFT_681974 [Lasiosphaeria miniovina]